MLIISTVTLANDVEILVNIIGAPEGKTETLLSGLSIVRQNKSEQMSDRLVRKLHKQAENELKQMLQVYGYYNISVSSQLDKTSVHTWKADYRVKLGQQVKLDMVVLTFIGEAVDDIAFKKFKDKFPLKQGAAKKSLLSLAAQRGYFDGKLITHKVEVNSEKYTASIYLYYSSGKRYSFSEIQYPTTVLTDELLVRLTPIKQGEPYLAAKVLRLRNNLTNSGYFDAVSVTTLIDGRNNGQVPLEITYLPDAKHLYTASLGFGTDTGLRLGVGWENRYVNEHGHRLSADTLFSKLSKSVAMDYRMPFWSETVTDVGFNTEYKQENTETSDSNSFAIGSYYKTKRWGWHETGSLKLLNESFEVSDDIDTSLLLISGISWSKIWADDTIYTKKGGRLSLSLAGASQAVLSDTSFAQAVVRGKYIHSTSDNGRLITRGTLGVTEVTDFTRLPSSLRFFAGGDNTIRGFEFESLGPLGSDGKVEGGRYLVIGSVEYEHMIIGNWGAAIFSDFGNALNSWDDPLEYSVGIGARWRSPVGLIRVDVAAGLSAEDKPIGLHVVIGPDL